MSYFTARNYNIIDIVNSSGRLVKRYEYTPYGKRTVYTHGWYLADMNGDGLVDQADYTIYADQYGETGEASSADINCDGEVDQADFTAYTDQYGETGEASSADLNGDGDVDQADYVLWSDAIARGDGIPEADSLVMQPMSKSYRSRDRATLTATPLNDFGHQGLMHDEDIGYKSSLIHNRARTLNADFGRFNQHDPNGMFTAPNFTDEKTNHRLSPNKQYTDGMSLYQYALSNPNQYSDPNGLWLQYLFYTTKVCGRWSYNRNQPTGWIRNRNPIYWYAVREKFAPQFPATGVLGVIFTAVTTIVPPYEHTSLKKGPVEGLDLDPLHMCNIYCECDWYARIEATRKCQRVTFIFGKARVGPVFTESRWRKMWTVTRGTLKGSMYDRMACDCYRPQSSAFVAGGL